MPSSPGPVAMAITITSDGWIRMESNRTAVVVRHIRRTAGASVQNIPPSKEFLFQTKFQHEGKKRKKWENARWRPIEMPRRVRHVVPIERGSREGDARSPCTPPTRPSGPCLANRARRPIALARRRPRPCASRTEFASTRCWREGEGSALTNTSWSCVASGMVGGKMTVVLNEWWVGGGSGRMRGGEGRGGERERRQ